MANEIERKFLLKALPPAADPTSKITYERHFLKIEPTGELRIQRKGSEYYRERKITNDKLSSTKEVEQITEEEFNALRPTAIFGLERDSYTINGIPGATVKVYHRRYEGLIRAEVEFPDSKAAEQFIPPEWFGSEITNSNLGRDSQLVLLSDSDFKALLNKTSA